MGVNAEILRNLQDAEKRGDTKAATIWQSQLMGIRALEDAGLITQLPHQVFNKEDTRDLLKTPDNYEALQAELEAQAKRYTQFGFPKRLGLSLGKFKDRAMGLAVPQPEAYRGRFDIPAIVIGTEIPAAEQYGMIGFDYYLGSLKVQDSDSQGYKTSNVPHLVWMQDGKKILINLSTR